MRREHRDELFRSCLTVNALLRAELKDVRSALKAREAEAKFNPNWRQQPRAPRGTADGGQWVDGGRGGGPKQALQRRPRETANPREAGRLSVPDAAEPNSGVQLPLSLFRAVPLSLALPLYGDTPRPIITSYVVPGADDLVLVVVNDRQSNQTHATFRRIVQPERRRPLVVFGVETEFQTTEPAQLEILEVPVGIDGHDVSFDGRALASAYGAHIPGVTTNNPLLAPADGIAVLDDEEAMFVAAWRAAGRTREQTETALDTLRRNRENNAPTAVRRREPGVARTSRAMHNVVGRWLRGTSKNAGVFPGQVAQRLEGRVYNNFRQFRREFWRAVADTPELARQFPTDELVWMRRGFAPIAPRDQWFGGQTTYIIHHRRPIARGGEIYDMSNMMIVTPRNHHDVLSRSFHYRRRRRQP